jgi:2-dehydro-3-deoxyphosphogluconate aldolase/(4S)-4-hydroxy-2-oxoglutarate aldolase
MTLTGAQFIAKVSEAPIIPVFSHDDKDVSYKVVKACYEGGIRIFEFTNRTSGAIEVFKYLVSRISDFPGLALGAGTIMDRNQAEAFYQAGASFIVAPIIDAEVAAFCKSKGISWTPGCGTLTELVTAERMGASLMKIFPADVLGPKFIRGVLGPCPGLKLMPTGGVTTDRENLTEWFKAGVVCVGMGSQLISKDLIKQERYAELTTTIAAALRIVGEIRS